VRQRLLIVLFSALVFGAGFAARMWTESDPSVPPAPAAIGSEFSRGAAPSADPKSAPKAGGRAEQSVDRAKLVKEIQRYRSDIETYRARLEQLDADFDRELTPLLTADQREKFAAQQKRYAERRARGIAAVAAETAPLSDEQIFRLQQRPLLSVLGEVSLSMRFDSLQKDLKLDEGQQAKVRELLHQRREKFLSLLDATPPPSIMLSRLAPVAQKLATEPKKD
jgi:hypothetical protein